MLKCEWMDNWERKQNKTKTLTIYKRVVNKIINPCTWKQGDENKQTVCVMVCLFGIRELGSGVSPLHPYFPVWLVGCKDQG